MVRTYRRCRQCSRSDECRVSKFGKRSSQTSATYHNIRAGELLPRLDREASERSTPHAIVHEFSPTLWREALSGQHRDDLLIFGDDVFVCNVAVRLDFCENAESLLSAVDLCEPTRTLREEGKTDHEKDAGHELNAPSCSERGCGIRVADVGASITNKVPFRTSENALKVQLDDLHDKNAPLDSQLLDDDDSTALRMLRNFRKINRHLGRSDSDCDTIEYTSRNEHASAIARNLKRSSNKPEDTRE